MHVYFISKKWEQSQFESVVYLIKAWTNIFPFLLHILMAFVSLFGLNPKHAYVCSFNWFQAKSIFWTYARKCLQKMMSLVFIVVLCPVDFPSILLVLVGCTIDHLLPLRERWNELQRCDTKKEQAEYGSQSYKNNKS